MKNSHPILENLRKLDIESIRTINEKFQTHKKTNDPRDINTIVTDNERAVIWSVLRFLIAVEETYTKATELYIDQFGVDGELKGADPVGSILFVNLNELRMSASRVTNADLKALGDIEVLLKKTETHNRDTTSRSNQDKEHSPAFALTILQSLFTQAIKEEQEEIKNDILKAVKIAPTFLSEDSSLNDRLIAADAALAQHLIEEDAADSSLIQMQEIDPDNTYHPAPEDTEGLPTLSRLADQLMKDAECREKDFPEEKRIAARLRLTINLQRAQPRPRKEFNEKLKSQLEKAQPVFSRHRNSLALRILGRIAAVAGIVIASVVPGGAVASTIAQAVSDGLQYKKTGRLGLFDLSEKTAAQGTVSKLGSEHDATMSQKP